MRGRLERRRRGLRVGAAQRRAGASGCFAPLPTLGAAEPVVERKSLVSLKRPAGKRSPAGRQGHILCASCSFPGAAEGGKCTDPSLRPLLLHGGLWVRARATSVMAEWLRPPAWAEQHPRGRENKLSGRVSEGVSG